MTKTKLQVGELLQNPRLVGGEIEVQERDKIYRGPIKSIWLSGFNVNFDLEWCAYYDMGTDKWTASNKATTAVIDKRGLNIVTKDPSKKFVMTHPTEFIVATIYPLGSQKLDPKEVIGLDLSNLPKPVIVEVD